MEDKEIEELKKQFEQLLKEVKSLPKRKKEAEKVKDESIRSARLEAIEQIEAIYQSISVLLPDSKKYNSFTERYTDDRKKLREDARKSGLAGSLASDLLDATAGMGESTRGLDGDIKKLRRAQEKMLKKQKKAARKMERDEPNLEFEDDLNVGEMFDNMLNSDRDDPLHVINPDYLNIIRAKLLVYKRLSAHLEHFEHMEEPALVQSGNPELLPVKKESFWQKLKNRFSRKNASSHELSSQENAEISEQSRKDIDNDRGNIDRKVGIKSPEEIEAIKQSLYSEEIDPTDEDDLNGRTGKKNRLIKKLNRQIGYEKREKRALKEEKSDEDRGDI